jgi:hypothetical protein
MIFILQESLRSLLNRNLQFLNAVPWNDLVIINFS